jgi:hypothetical protein
MARHFRIHPAIGIARVGNAPGDAFFVGPEHPEVPANWRDGSFQSFRDAQGRIKRQAVRFRVFEYQQDAQGALSDPHEVEVGGDILKIEWRVHVANKKAAFFAFYGQHGADDLYVTRSQTAANQPIEGTDPIRTNLRNADVAANDRAQQLVLDPGEQMISTDNPQAVVLTHQNPNVAFIKDLGEVRLDGARLVFLGGHGDSGSTASPPVKIDEYANNDTWFDDVSDGSVKARLFFKDQTHIDADAAWVTVAPPDFAPGIGNVVTLYDLLWDLAVRELPLPKNSEFAHSFLARLATHKQHWSQSGSLAGYQPSFRSEIYPLLTRAFGAFWVFDAKESNQSFHISFAAFDQCATPSNAAGGASAQRLREAVCGWLRDPGSNDVNWKGMPRGFGDRYNDIDDDAHTADPKSFLSLTPVQHAVLTVWGSGSFDTSDWTGSEPEIPNAIGALSPQDLDRAALLNAVGGPFYPGIEVSWLVRNPDLYAEPFRLKVPSQPEDEAGGVSNLKIGALTFGPGFLSQQMALPWQADFYDCHKERMEGPDATYTFMWWTAQRPDDVLTAQATKPNEARSRWVRLFDAVKETDDPDDLNNLARFAQMQQNWSQLKFIVGNRNLFKEEA